MIEQKVNVKLDDAQLLFFYNSDQAQADTDRLIAICQKAERFRFFHSGFGFWLLNRYIVFLMNRMAKKWITV